MTPEVNIRIIIEQPLPAVIYALQKGSGVNYETFQGQQAKDQDLLFYGVIGVKGAEVKDDLPDFNGPFVQGPKTARFLYIDIGSSAGQTNSIWNRRLKIPLIGITWAMIREINANNDFGLLTKVPGIAKDGGPNCATVKPFAGWQVKNLT